MYKHFYVFLSVRFFAFGTLLFIDYVWEGLDNKNKKTEEYFFGGG